MNVVVNGHLLQYLEAGDVGSPAILMLHGWGASSQNFSQLAGHLATRFRVISLDLPGFGGSEPPPTAWHIEDYAKFVSAALSKLEVNQLEAVIGHSFGGRILIKAVAQGFIKPRRAILMGSAGIKHSDTLRNQIFKIVAKTGKAATMLPGLTHLRHRLRRNLYRAAGSDDYLKSGELRQIFVNTINEDLTSDAATINIPVLLIWGEADTDTPPADGRLLSHVISHSTLRIVAGAGHYVHLDAPDETYKYIGEFLQ